MLSPRSTSEELMTHSGNSPRRLIKGLLMGGLLGGALVCLYALGGGAELGSEIRQKGIRSQRRYRPFFATRVEKTDETVRPAKPSIGWLATFVLAAVVAMIADVRIEKT
jgi:hypothetical protein